MDNIEDKVVGTCGCGCADIETPETAEQAVEQAVSEPQRAYVPAVDVIDGQAEVVLVADLPGVTESGLDITLEKNILTIKAKPAQEGFEGYTPLYAEYGVGDYQRSFSLSEEVDRDGITASIKDGVLQVRIPKAKPVSKKITVANV